MAYYQEIRYCIVPNPSLLGDGICHNFDKYNTAGCNFDSGDCIDFNKKYPDSDCKAPYAFLLGDGKCDGTEYNNPECSFDGGDCDVFNADYPDCNVDKPHLIGNGICDGVIYNMTECGFDGSDCLDFWGKHPDCVVDEAWRVGNNDCDLDHNTEACAYDDGDCDNWNDFLERNPECEVPDIEYFTYMIRNSYCNAEFNTPECAYDDGECTEFNLKYPNCTFPLRIGNEYCESEANTADCGFDGGDCKAYNNGFLLNFPDCDVDYPFLLGNGICDHGNYNTAECNFDDGDCIEWNLQYPDCFVDDDFLIGNGVCNGPPYNTEECLFDGGDCLQMDAFVKEFPDCVVENVLKLGNGQCDEDAYNTAECGYDNGDCISVYTAYPECFIPIPFFLGDGFFCDPLYNTPECGFDGGDCEEFNSNYPACKVDNPFRVRDSVCSGRQYNVAECGFDGRDCDKFNEFIRNNPDCEVEDEEESFIGDGMCNGKYNTPKCSWDDGDCDSFNAQYPGCPIEHLVWLEDGSCDGLYNTPECAYDKGDCEEFNAKYLDCYGVNLEDLGDGVCQHNSAGCNFDDGDCTLFNQIYPSCSADKPYMIGDGYCDDEYNTQDCKNDGGDCSTSSARFLLVGGKLIGVDEYQKNTRTYSIIQIVSSTASVLASIGIAWIIYRSLKKLSVPFHRLLLGLCVADICSSFAQCFFTLPAPDSFDVIWNAHGTKASCRAQGFFIFIGSIAAPLYNCSLCFYYFLVVTYRKGKGADSYIEGKIEFFLHAVPIGVSLIGATTILALDAFHPNMTYCFIGSDPSCEGPGCERADQNAKILFGVFSGGPYITLPCVILTTMSFMYRAVRVQEKRMQKFGVGALRLKKANAGSKHSSNPTSIVVNTSVGTSSNRDSEDINGFDGTSLRQMLGRLKSNLSVTSMRLMLSRSGPSERASKSKNTGKQSRAIMNRAFSYSAAFFVTYLFPIIISIRTLSGYESGHMLSILARIFFPLQGFFNFVVFIYPKVLHAKTVPRKKVTWYQAFVTAVQSRGKPKQNRKIKSNRHVKRSASSRFDAFFGRVGSMIKKKPKEDTRANDFAPQDEDFKRAPFLTRLRSVRVKEQDQKDHKPYSMPFVDTTGTSGVDSQKIYASNVSSIIRNSAVKDEDDVEKGSMPPHQKSIRFANDVKPGYSENRNFDTTNFGSEVSTNSSDKHAAVLMKAAGTVQEPLITNAAFYVEKEGEAPNLAIDTTCITVSADDSPTKMEYEENIGMLPKSKVSASNVVNMPNDDELNGLEEHVEHISEDDSDIGISSDNLSKESEDDSESAAGNVGAYADPNTNRYAEGKNSEDDEGEEKEDVENSEVNEMVPLADKSIVGDQL